MVSFKVTLSSLAALLLSGQVLAQSSTSTDTLPVQSSTSTLAPLPSASNVINPATGMVTDDISAEPTVDNRFFFVALAALLNADVNWILNRTATFTSDPTLVDITIYCIETSSWFTVGVNYTATQAQGLMGDANGGAWWSSAWRMAALATGAPGAASMTNMTGVTPVTSLMMLTGKNATVSSVGDNDDLYLEPFSTVLSYAQNIPVIVQSSAQATTLEPSMYLAVMSYDPTQSLATLNDLSGLEKGYDVTDVYGDVERVFYVPDLYVLE